MRRGRPTKSTIRQNIIEILFYMKKAYGYKIHKIYKQIFPSCTREVVYYHLKKGITLGEFEIQEIKQERGDYSWGIIVEKKYYKLGPKAKPIGLDRVKKFLDENPKYLGDAKPETTPAPEDKEVIVRPETEPAIVEEKTKELVKTEEEKSDE